MWECRDFAIAWTLAVMAADLEIIAHKPAADLKVIDNPSGDSFSDASIDLSDAASIATSSSEPAAVGTPRPFFRIKLKEFLQKKRKQTSKFDWCDPETTSYLDQLGYSSP